MRKEEYFLWPNWNNAPGNGDGVWVGKYMASHSDATKDSIGSSTIPVSIRGVDAWTKINQEETLKILQSRNSRCRTWRNREWASIAYWCLHHGYDDYYSNTTKYITGFIFGYESETKSARLDMINIQQSSLTKIRSHTNKFDENGGGYKKVYNEKTNSIYVHTFTGSGPNSWRHNLKESGIADMIGNYSEHVIGFTHIAKTIYIYDENNKFDTSTTYIPHTNYYYNNGTLGYINTRRIYYHEENINDKLKPDVFSYEGIPVTSNTTYRKNSDYYITTGINVGIWDHSADSNIKVANLHNKTIDKIGNPETYTFDCHWNPLNRGPNCYYGNYGNSLFHIFTWGNKTSNTSEGNLRSFRVLFEMI